jgi:erythromycin esterase
METCRTFVSGFTVWLLYAGVIIHLACCGRPVRENDGQLVKQVIKISDQIPDTDPEMWETPDFRRWKIPGKAVVVGVGEATHGSSTLFGFKKSLVRYLIEERGFRLLCYEFSFEQSLEIDKFINGEAIDIDSLLRRQYWIQANQSILDLLYWLRSYNAIAPVNEKVHFIGVDCQTDMFSSHRLRYHMRQIEPNLEKELYATLSELESFGKPVYKGMTDEEYSSIESIIDLLRIKAGSFFTREGDYSETVESKEVIMHLIKCLELSHKFLYSAYNGGQNFRDQYMRDNILSSINFFSGNAKAIFWSHNAHVRADPDYYGEGQPSAGALLRENFGDKYLIIGTAFSNGRITAVEEDPVTGNDTPPHEVEIDTIPATGSLNDLFSKTGWNAFVSDLRRAKSGKALSEFLKHDLLFLGVGDFYSGKIIDHFIYYRGPVAGEFDLIFYFETIAPLSLL